MEIVFLLWLTLKLAPYVLIILLIIWVLSYGPYLILKRHKKVGYLTTLGLTIPLSIYFINELIIRPNEFKKLCVNTANSPYITPIKTNKLALDIKHYAYHSGITIDSAIEKVISREFKEVEIINNPSEKFQKMVNKYGLIRKNTNTPSPEVFVFSISNKGDINCWWNDFIDTSIESWNNPARATKHFKFEWDKVNSDNNKCISLQYRKAVTSKYIVEIREDILSKYNFSKYSILLHNNEDNSDVVIGKIVYQINPRDIFTSKLLDFTNISNMCPQNSLVGEHINLFFSK